MDHLHVKGAREHNLKNIDITLPRDEFIVITGLSGSGKSSLAFDTIYAEGQRRYVESLSAYARQFLGQMDLPDVDIILVPVGGGGLAAGVATLAKQLNPNVKVYGVEPRGAACLCASLEAKKPMSLGKAVTIADGVAVRTPGSSIFPYLAENVDGVLQIDDDELVDAFLDMMEKHKLVVENAGLVTVAALKQIQEKGKNIVSVLSGGNMDVITIASLVQHGLINRGRVFSFSVLLPDRPGELVAVARVVSEQNGNIIKLDHNQFVSINRQNAVELRVTLEAFGHEHKERILDALRHEGYDAQIVQTTEV